MANDEQQLAKPIKSVPGQIEKLCGRWFIPAVGFIYATGFLIVFTFFKGYGITDINFIEAKYIHVGSLFLFACIIIILPLTWIRYVRRPPMGGYPHTTIPTILGATLLLYVLFAVVAFAPHGFAHEYWVLLLLNLSIPIFMLLTGMIADWVPNMETPFAKSVIVVVQWVLLIVQICVVFLTFKGLDNFWIMCRQEPVCFAFVGLMILIFSYGWRLIHRLPQATIKGQQLDLLVSNGCIIGSFVFLAIVTFSHSIYPYIPASKGGGNFTDETPIHIIFKPDFTESAPKEVGVAEQGNHLILLEESSGFVFVADKTAVGGTTNWQNDRPPVYEIRLDTIMTIVRNNTDSVAGLTSSSTVK